MRSENSPVEVTAVFINCEMDDLLKHSDDENSRFEREELFKHNALRNCDKKLTLTIKLSSASAKSADEYVPIDHVVDGHSKKRVRLLNPYVLRLRRDAPLEAYKLKFIETVHGMLATANEQNQKYRSDLWKRTVDSAETNSVSDWGTVGGPGAGESRRARCALRLAGAALAGLVPSSQARGHNEQRQFRVAGYSETPPRFPTSPRFSRGSSRPPANCSTRSALKINTVLAENAVYSTKRTKRHEKNVIIEEESNFNKRQGGREYSLESRFAKTNNNEALMDGKQQKSRLEQDDNINAFGKEFALYELQNPTLWFDVHIHLFEKLSTIEGHTLWNDISKGVPVSLSSLSRAWSGPDMSVHYKPVDMAREDFSLPQSSLCLLIPLLEENMNTASSNSVDGPNYILVPSEDVLDIEKTDKSKRTYSNISTDGRSECHRKVVVRVARALRNFKGDQINIVDQASEKFLTMRHRGIRHAQVDLEAKADDNQLVHTSASGRIAIIVAENTRDKRTTLTVQATNTGLFASQFRIQLRECDLVKLSEKQGGSVVSAAVVLPPRHTRRLRLRLPAVVAADLQHCSSDNPKLPCREMSAEQQDAAGLPLPARRAARFARACRYTDVTTVNVAVVVVGVVGMLLFLGFLKGLLGVVWTRAGVWGLDWMLEEPRRLARYHERALRGRAVVYDGKSWPVHPDTGQRTVRVVSLAVEFTLNIVFFVVAPSLITVDALKRLSKRTAAVSTMTGSDNKTNAQKSKRKFNSRHDVQGRKRGARARARLSQTAWMSPGAEDLSETIWSTETTTLVFNNSRSMFPLLPEKHLKPELDPAQSSGSDSELEDTAFVLMHMQKSTESLARNQMQPNIAGLSNDVSHKSNLQTTGTANLD